MDTITARGLLDKAKTVYDFDEFRKEMKEATLDWENYYRNVVADFVNRNIGMTQMEFYSYAAKQCGVSEDTVRKTWKKKFPSKRIEAIILFIALNFSVEEINHALKRYGKQPSLYVKTISDAICIYIAQTADENGDTLIRRYERIEQSILRDIDDSDFENVLDKINSGYSSSGTRTLETTLKKVQDEENFYDFVKTNLHEFKTAYQNLYKHIENYMEENDFTMNTVTKYEGLPTNFNVKYSNIKKLCQCPSRNDLIALGIAIRMTVDELNQLLSKARMEPMYPKDRMEAAIIFVISDIKRNFPDIFNDNSTDTGFGLSDADIQEYLNYRKYRNTEYIDMKDPEMMNYLKMALYNIEPNLWIDTKNILGIMPNDDN